MALGAWGAVFASGEGLGLALSGAMKDGIARLVSGGVAGAGDLTGYNSVYVLEVLALMATLAALGPLARASASSRERPTERFGLVDLPS